MVAVILAVTILYRSGVLAWMALTDESVDAMLATDTPPAPESPTTQAPAVDYSRIAESHLFGMIASGPVNHVPNAEPEAPTATTLSLTLKATITDSGDDGGGVAIITGGGVERIYFATDDIEGAEGTRLHSIHSDRVVVSRNGQLETLRFPESHDTGIASMPYAAAMSLSTSAQAPLPEAMGIDGAGGDSASSQPLSEDALLLRGVTAAGALPPGAVNAGTDRIADIVRVAEHVEAGRTVGLRVDPGIRSEQFAELGFEPGDVVTGINGSDMSDVERGLRTVERLGDNPMANVTVVRNGVARILTLDTSLLGDVVRAP